MKKFFSLVCALAIVLSASAVPAKKFVRDVKSPTKELRQAKFGAQIKDAKELQSEKFAKKAVLRAPKATAETTDYKIGQYAYQDYGDGDIWYALLSDDNSARFDFDLLLDAEATDVTLGTTYTIDVMDLNYSYGRINGAYFNYKTASFKKTLLEGDLVKIEAVVTDSSDNVYNLVYQEEPFVLTGDTVTYAIQGNAKMTYSSSWEDWTIKADDGVYAFTLDIYSDDATSPVGVYTNDDFDLNYTNVEVYTAADASNLYAAHEASAVITQSNDTTFIAATIIGEDGVVYELSAKFAAPKKEYEATITATNLNINDAYLSWLGVVVAQASNADYEVYVSLTPDEEATSYAGTYTIGDDASGDVTILAQDSAMVEFYSGTVTLAQSESGWALTGTVLAYNNTEYTLNLTYVKPVQTREETITIDGLAMNLLSGAWQIMGYNADSTQFVSIAAYADAVAGTYTEADLVASYSYVVTDITSSSYKQFALVGANLTVTYNEADSTAAVTGTFLGQNGDDVPLFTLNLTGKVPTPSPYLDYDTEDKGYYENFATYTVNDSYLAQYGDLLIIASNENGAKVGLDMYIGEGESTLTPGTYTISDSEEPMTLYPGSCDGSSVYYSFFGYTDAEGYITDMWFPVSGTVIVSETGVISVDALNSYGQRIVAQLGEWPEGIENTEAETVATKRIVNGQLVIEKNGVRYNAVGTVVK